MAYATIRDVAKRAGISVSTVSRAINNKGRISAKTKQLVEQAMKDLHYIPDSRAQALRSAKTKTVGLLIPDIRNSYFAALAYAVQDTLLQEGYCTFIGTSSENSEQQDAFITNILSQHIDGAIVVPQGAMTQALRKCMNRKLPLVFADRTMAEVEHVPYVDADPRCGIEQALQDFLAHGHRHVGYISGPISGSPTLQEREHVFQELASQMFGARNVSIATSDGHSETLLAAIDAMVARGVSAILFGYSPDAVQAIAQMHAMAGETVRSLSYVSFDDLELFSMLSPQVSVISQRVERIGRRAAGLFLDLMHGQQVSSERIQTQYLSRASVLPYTAA